MNFEKFYRGLLNSKEKLYCRMENLSSQEWCLMFFDEERFPTIHRFIDEDDLFYALKEIERDSFKTQYFLLSPTREVFTIRKEELESIVRKSIEKENVITMVEEYGFSLLEAYNFAKELGDSVVVTECWENGKKFTDSLFDFISEKTFANILKKYCNDNAIVEQILKEKPDAVKKLSDGRIVEIDDIVEYWE